MTAYGTSDRGCRRPTNQDAYALSMREEEGIAVIAVCDGMGGANAGNVASRFALDTFMERIQEQVTARMSREGIERALRDAADAANETVFRLSTRQPEFAGMGTTLVAGVITKEKAMLLNIGDSRAYEIDAKNIMQLTEDHSYVNEMIRQGKLRAEDARTHPNRNLITRAVGVDPRVEADVYEVDLREGEVLLLCSDGLNSMVEDAQIGEIIRRSGDLETAGQALVEAAKLCGGADNITVVLFSRDTSENEPAKHEE
ncbi:MAG: Stp1/IreP family PP2C-type Ser/Thr phosphatase [Clostridiaceae bacterium]|nr:Stp1/IreP family PP2C-type Ser/Thr phosphatase [Clostridiaceae bacterium]